MSALGFEGSGAALAARGVRLPAAGGAAGSQRGEEREARGGLAWVLTQPRWRGGGGCGRGWVLCLGGCVVGGMFGGGWSGEAPSALALPSSGLSHAPACCAPLPFSEAEGVEAELWPSAVFFSSASALPASLGSLALAGDRVQCYLALHESVGTEETNSFGRRVLFFFSGFRTWAWYLSLIWFWGKTCFLYFKEIGGYTFISLPPSGAEKSDPQANLRNILGPLPPLF